MFLGMTRKIAIEFEGGVVDARALARAIDAMVAASAVKPEGIFVDGFTMNPTDGWNHEGKHIFLMEK